MIELDCHIEGVRHRVRAHRSDRPWGHAVDVELFSSDGTRLNMLSFACHPEFDRYDEFQAKSTDELVACAIQQLQSRISLQQLRSVRAPGLCLCFRMNSPEASAPNRPATRQTGSDSAEVT